VHNPDHIFTEEEQKIRRRILMRGYLKDLWELTQASIVSGASEETASSTTTSASVV
jgi:hypothetical protein